MSLLVRVNGSPVDCPWYSIQHLNVLAGDPPSMAESIEDTSI